MGELRARTALATEERKRTEAQQRSDDPSHGKLDQSDAALEEVLERKRSNEGDQLEPDDDRGKGEEGESDEDAASSFETTFREGLEGRRGDEEAERKLHCTLFHMCFRSYPPGGIGCRSTHRSGTQAYWELSCRPRTGHGIASPKVVADTLPFSLRRCS